ncbi:MAG TPA: efflux RND transporter periplasmic adaptor subunit [Clostridia bacterium]|nr:efflux RND transporter periplasmic adaptor subunit [Clostridia bacterium]
MKKKIIWIGIIILVAVSIIVLKTKMGATAVPVESAKVIRGDIEEYVEETGNLMLEEETTVYTVAAGKILQVSKKAGETVKAGEIIAKIDDSDLLLQIKALEAQKQAASAKYDEVRDSTDEEELRKLNSQVRSAEASYEEAKRIMDNNRVLYEAGAVSLDTYKSSVTKFAAEEANLESAKSSLALAEKGASVNVRKQYEAQLSELQARIEQLKIKSEEMIIKSPIDGLILTSEVEKGSIMQAGTKLFEIGGSKGLYIESDVLIEDIAAIKVGSAVKIEDEDLGVKDLKGTVRKIHPKAVSIMSDLGIEQKRVKVEIGLNGDAYELRPGYDLTVKIITQSSKGTLLIAEKAVFDYQGKAHVFVIEQGAAQLRAIEKGLESDERVEVLKGLNEGEEVILSPDEALEAGTKVKTTEI